MTVFHNSRSYSLLSFFSILTLFGATYSHAQTSLSAGNVSGTWTKSASPYIVNGDLLIPKDSQLIIEPGVVVKFSDLYGIKVDGQIRAEGTQSEPISFSAVDYNKPWAGFLFINNTDSIVFKYCSFKEAGERSVLDSNGKYIRFNDLEVYRYTTLCFYNSKFINIDHCTFSQNNFSVRSFSSNVNITNTLFTNHKDNNLRDEFPIYSVNDSIRIENCIVEKCVKSSPENHVLIVVDKDSSGKCSLSNCTFRDNYKTVLAVGGPTDMAISGCIFENNFSNQSSGLALAGVKGVVQNCTFRNNTNTSFGNSIALGNDCSKVQINNCLFEENKGAFAISARGITQNPIIKNCKFKGNSGGIGVYDDGGFPILINCEFINNGYPARVGARMMLINCNIINNHGLIFQGSEVDHLSGFFVATGATLLMYNSILWGNNDTSNNKTQIMMESSSSKAYLYNCIVDQGKDGIQKGATNSFAFNGVYSNCSDQKPQWQNESTGDYRPLNSCGPNSNLFNTGSTDHISNSYLKHLDLDLNGNPRISAGQIDIGAYEMGKPKNNFTALSTPNDTDLCLGNNLTLKTQIFGADVFYEWQDSTDGSSWKFRGIKDSLPLGEAKSTGNTFYRLLLLNNCGSKDTIDPIEVRVQPNPVVDLGPDFSFREDSSRVLSESIPGTYLWSDQSTDTSLTLDGGELGVGKHQFWLEVTSQYGCKGRDTVNVEVTEYVGMSDLNISNFKVYPNPANDWITLPESTDKVTVYTLDGRILLKQDLKEGSKMDVSQLPNGSYILIAEGTSGRYLSKVIIK